MGGGHACRQRLGERGVERPGDAARDRVERLVVTAPALGSARVEEDERRVVEPGEDLVGVDRVVVALGGDEVARLRTSTSSVSSGPP